MESGKLIAGTKLLVIAANLPVKLRTLHDWKNEGNKDLGEKKIASNIFGMFFFPSVSHGYFHVMHKYALLQL